MAAEDLKGEVVTEGECTGCTTRERSVDVLARGLANGTVSRRKALWMLGGALMGSALGFTPRAASAEKCKPLAHKCAANIQCCSRRCDKQGQICVCPPQTQIACQGPKGQAKCINICHDPTNPCETSLCDPTTGKCVVKKLTGTPCSDSNSCTLGDTCQNGTCQPGPVRTCGQCLKCNPANGTCEPDANQIGNPCNDSNACTTNDRCTAAGVCAGGEPVDCDDPNPCTIDTCNPATGCVHTNVANGIPCETGNLCTNDTCQNGTCTQGTVNVNCGQCLNCDPDTGGCVPDPNQVGNPCNDSNACTKNDRCTAVGTCVGEPVDCDDNNPCTIDTCNPATGCVHTNLANNTPCETGNLCTNDTCQNGTCTQGPVNVSCGQCLRCNPATGTCVPDLTKNGTSCNDGNACTTGETCQNGVCAGGTLKSCSACQQCNPVTGDCDRVTGTPCGAQGSGRTCCVGTCCQNTEICCSTGPFAGQCKKASGQFCSNNNNCCSQNCSGGICL